MDKDLKRKLEQAEAYIATHGRGVERARFDFLFQNGSKEKVIEELKKYQNEDGGFGHGIEPDFWLPASSAIGTWTAGQILLEIGAGQEEPMVMEMLTYLVNTADTKTGIWETVRPANNEYPHAPWWHWQEGAQENWMFNPGAELAGFLVHWSASETEAWHTGWNSIEKAVNHLMNQSEMDWHEVNNFLHLMKIIKPFEQEFNSKLPYRLEDAAEKVFSLAEKAVERNVAEWGNGYKALPLDFVDGPDNPLSERFGPLVEQNFHFYLETMDEEGVWDTSWSWGMYPEEAEAARRYWKGILAVRRYKLFQAFGYL
ncbi:hypothetical protein A8F94_18360 [Bacillus sp. FJAT-27225]|uniref:hypothetical protein n=1 Tax=Bacillus sp. FJAT-27225 TaxID=1743144 RepID=UPI00080C27C9|nr:hypothetical protein [Bacillus sp. FJAT-27225]OCA83097.1 hypothetical protein A8F94_18360 [Bacillus sp. FJAT-27225]